MSNSSLVSYTKLSPNNSGQRTHAIDRITPHHVVGLCSVEALGEAFASTSRQASSNYGIGKDGRVGMYVPENCRSWCSSSEANDQRAVTIECADEASYPYTFPDVVYSRLIDLCVDICKRNGKNKLVWVPNSAEALAYKQASNEMLLTVHRWFASTACPGAWMMEHMADLAEQVTARLREWNFTGDSTPAKWSKEAVEWAVDNGLLAGNDKGDLMLRSPITREQFCVILKKYHDTFKGV